MASAAKAGTGRGVNFPFSMFPHKLTTLFKFAGVDRPVFYIAVGRAWTLFSGPMTILFLTCFFTPKEQGYYYTFGSVVGLQMFLELGFAQCIVQFASHEFAHLRFGPKGALAGDPRALSRLLSLGRLSLKWYGVMALLVVGGIGIGGHWFFSIKNDATVAWKLPWWALSAVTGLGLAILPVGALIEGCNQLAFLYGARTLAAILGSLVLWTALSGGAGLFSGAIVALAGILLMAVAYLRRWPKLLAALLHAPQEKGEAISWRHEIWPFQWRIAVTWLSGYFMINFFTPVLFYFHGPVVAGQMGMTMQLVNSLNALASSWTGTKGPRYGMLISQRNFAELDRMFFRATAQSVGVCALGGLGLLLVLGFLQGHFAFGTRFLGVGPTSLLVLACVVNQIVFGQAVYLRAHKREPFMWLTLAGGLATGLLTVLLGRFYGAWGVCLAYSAVQTAGLVWAGAIWKRCRRDWHQAEDAT